MPYITQRERELVDSEIFKINTLIPNEGMLAYIITKLLLAYVREHGIRYCTWTNAVGIIETVKLELYRHWMGDYEEEAHQRNGDVPW